MSSSNKLAVRFTMEDGTNSTMSIASYTTASATQENLQTLADAAADVLETADGATLRAITKVTQIVTSETVISDSLTMPITPSGS